MPCVGFWCSPERVAGAIVLGLIVVALIARVLVRYVPVNLARRRQGLPPLRWREIGSSRMRSGALAQAARTDVVAERELQRQTDWEKEQATHELMRAGTHVTRQFCAEHERWCFHSWEEGHPPGGFDNPTAPDDWPPDLRRRR